MVDFNVDTQDRRGYSLRYRNLLSNVALAAMLIEAFDLFFDATEQAFDGSELLFAVDRAGKVALKFIGDVWSDLLTQFLEHLAAAYSDRFGVSFADLRDQLRTFRAIDASTCQLFQDVGRAGVADASAFGKTCRFANAAAEFCKLLLRVVKDEAEADGLDGATRRDAAPALQMIFVRRAALALILW